VNILTKEQFIKRKKSDTAIILGSGYSINSIKEKHWKVISEHDTFALNWFCFHKFEPSFYHIREQANIPKRRSKTETVERFIESINRYAHTCAIIINTKKQENKPKFHNYARSKHIKLDSIILRDKKVPKSKMMLRFMGRDPFNKGAVHGFSSMIGILHIIKFLSYKRIVFAGVDLYDSRYFWLPRDVTRHTVRSKQKGANDQHTIANKLIKFVSRYQQRFSIQTYTLNRRSLLMRGSVKKIRIRDL